MILKILKKKFNFFNSKPQYFVHKTAQIEEPDNVTLLAGCEIWEYVIIRKGLNITIGNNAQIGPFSVFFGGEKIIIGNNVIIAPHCVFAAGNHNYYELDIPMRFSDSISKGPIIIEDNVWVGSNVVITDNVKIGHDSVIGANAVVTKNVEPYSIVGGVPAKLIKYRK